MQRFYRVLAMIGLGFSVLGCQARRSALDDLSTNPASFYLAMGDATNAPGAYRIYASPTQEVDPSSVVFCFSANCDSPDAWVSATIAKTKGGRTIYASSEPLTPHASEPYSEISVKATKASANGEPSSIVQSVKLIPRDAGPSGDHVSENASLPANCSSDLLPGDQTCGGEVDPQICQIELGIVCETNRYRSESGLPLLKHASQLSTSARLWSSAQAQRGTIGHDGFPNARQQVEGLVLMRENVLQNYRQDDVSATAKALALQWYNSTGHRENMLATDIDTIGTGVAQGENGTLYGTQIFAAQGVN